MSETEWEYLSAEDGKQIAELDRFLDVVSRLSYWQCWDESTLSWRNCVKPSGRQVDKNPDKFRRRKDTPNWIAEKCEAGHELTYLETAFYYILNYNSMKGLEAYFSESDEWRASDERHHPVPKRRYRLAKKKKPMVIVNGHKVPKWETEPLSEGDDYFLVQPRTNNGYNSLTWCGDAFDRDCLKEGAVFKSESDIKEFVEAMRDIKEVTE